MKINAAQLCELLQGELVGDGAIQINGPSQIDKGIPGTVSFLANPKYEEFAYTTEASVLIVPRDFVPRMPIKQTLVKVDNVYGAMMFLVENFSQNGVPEKGVSDQAYIAENTHLGEDISIGAFSVIEKDCSVGSGSIIYPQVFIGHGCTIGKGVVIYPGVRIYPLTEIGDRCIVHANAVIGCDGFGYRPDEKGHYAKIRHVGKVILEEDVEIGANTVIDRGTLTFTRIGKGTKIDNLVQVAHNVVIGEHTVIAAQAGIAGSTAVGKHSRIGGQVGIVGHLTLPDGLEVQAQSGVHSDKHGAGAKLFGYPAIRYNDYLKSYAVFKQLPEYAKRIAELEKEIAALKGSQL